MKRLFLIVPIVLLSMLSACVETECCKTKGESSANGDAWLLVEIGYSPGAGYIVEPVSSDPAQTIKLNDDKSFFATVNGLEKFKFYRKLDDPNTDMDIIALYEKDPGNITPDIDKLEHSYSMKLDDTGLTLYYRFCIEGCHLRFTKMKSDK